MKTVFPFEFFEHVNVAQANRINIQHFLKLFSEAETSGSFIAFLQNVENNLFPLVAARNRRVKYLFVHIRRKLIILRYFKHTIFV